MKSLFPWVLPICTLAKMIWIKGRKINTDKWNNYWYYLWIAIDNLLIAIKIIIDNSTEVMIGVFSVTENKSLLPKC